MAKPMTNRTILWIPTLQYLDGKAFESTPQNLQDALKKRGILYEKLYYPMGIAPQSFPAGKNITLDVDETFGLPFEETGVQGKQQSSRGLQWHPERNARPGRAHGYRYISPGRPG